MNLVPSPTEVAPTVGAITSLPVGDLASRLWPLYAASGLLSAQKVALLGGDMVPVRQTLDLTASLLPSCYRVLVESREQNLIAACTLAAFSDAEWWVMHLASLKSRLALFRVMSQLKAVVKGIDESLVTFRFRTENESVHRFLNVPAAGPLVRSCGYFIGHRELQPPPGGSDFELSEMSPGDVPRLPRTTLSWWSGTIQNREDWGVARLAREYAAIGLCRRRVVWEVRHRRRVCLYAVLDISPSGWNLSNLGTCVEIFAVEAESHLHGRAAQYLVARSAEWFAANGIERWLIACDSAGSTIRDALRCLGLIERPNYTQISVPSDLGPELMSHYLGRLSRGGVSA